MVRQERDDLSGLPALAGLVDFLVLDVGAVEDAGQARLHGVIDVTLAAPGVAVHALLQQWIGPAEQQLVKIAMVLQPAADVLLLLVLAQPHQERTEFLDIRLRHIGDRDGGGNAFVGDARNVKRFQLARIKAQYPAAIIGLGLDQALLFQHAQRLADRRAADLQAIGHFDLRQDGFRRQRVRQDAVAQVLMDVDRGSPVTVAGERAQNRLQLRNPARSRASSHSAMPRVRSLLRR
jgi:hypothetical protein